MTPRKLKLRPTTIRTLTLEPRTDTPGTQLGCTIRPGDAGCWAGASR